MDPRPLLYVGVWLGLAAAVVGILACLVGLVLTIIGSIARQM